MVYFVFGRLESHASVNQIYLQDFYNTSSCFIQIQMRKLYILQVVSAGFPQCKVTFQQVSVAETVHTPSFQIDSACWNYLESPSFSKFRKPSGISDTLGFQIAETCWISKFQVRKYGKPCGDICCRLYTYCRHCSRHILSPQSIYCRQDENFTTYVLTICAKVCRIYCRPTM